MAGLARGTLLRESIQLLLFFLFRKVAPKLAKPSPKELNPWDEANLLQNMKQENVHITTVAQQRYVYRESAAGAGSTCAS
jgi:hypothetical protein